MAMGYGSNLINHFWIISTKTSLFWMVVGWAVIDGRLLSPVFFPHVHVNLITLLMLRNKLGWGGVAGFEQFSPAALNRKHHEEGQCVAPTLPWCYINGLAVFTQSAAKAFVMCCTLFEAFSRSLLGIFEQTILQVGDIYACWIPESFSSILGAWKSLSLSTFAIHGTNLGLPGVIHCETSIFHHVLLVWDDWYKPCANNSIRIYSRYNHYMPVLTIRYKLWT